MARGRVINFAARAAIWPQRDPPNTPRASCLRPKRPKKMPKKILKVSGAETVNGYQRNPIKFFYIASRITTRSRLCHLAASIGAINLGFAALGALQFYN
jgi:hypothetical protein